MNKNMTLLILAAILGAMILVFYAHVKNSSPDANTQPANAVQMQAVLGTKPEEDSEQGSATVNPNQQKGEDFKPLGERNVVVVTPDGKQVPLPESNLPSELTDREKPIQEMPKITINTGDVKPLQAHIDANMPKVEGTPAPSSVEGGGSVTLPAQVAQPVEPEKLAASTPALSKPLEATKPSDELKPQESSKPHDAAQTSKTTQVSETAKPTEAQASTVKADGVVTLEGMELVFVDNKLRLKISAAAHFEVRIFELIAPDRVVIDLLGDWKNIKAPLVPTNPIAKSARIGKQPKGYRLVLDLVSPLKKRELIRGDNSLELIMW